LIWASEVASNNLGKCQNKKNGAIVLSSTYSAHKYVDGWNEYKTVNYIASQQRIGKFHIEELRYYM